ncbi:MAG: OB-fold nucleic acid binding domain-containing protein, partial [Anaerolineae bacterium]
ESRELGSLTAADEGGWYRVQGRVVAMTGLKGGMKATLDDGTGQIFLLIWDSVYDALPEPQALDVGAEVEVEGEIQLYEGDLELVPEQPEDIRIQVAAPESPWVEVSTLSGLDAGRVVRLRGVLGEPQAFSAGIKAPLDDGTGTITVLLWSNVAEVLEPPPAGGLLVEVVGEISLYRDELEIIPRSRHDWRPEP